MSEEFNQELTLDECKERISRMSKEELMEELANNITEEAVQETIRRTLDLIYVLDENKRPVHPKTMDEYNELMWGKDRANKVVAKDTHDNFYISTVFLGMDHGFGSPPQFFETMVFDQTGETSYNNNKLNEIFMDRYETWEQAEEGHRRILDKVKKGEQLDVDE